FCSRDPTSVTGHLRQGALMSIRSLQKSLKKFCRIRTTLDRQKINDLNEEFSVAAARLTDCFDQFLQSGNKSMVADAEQRPAGNIPYAGGFDDQCARLSLGESPIPINVVLCDKAVFGCAPRHHRRYPGTTFERQRPNRNGLKEERKFGFCRRWPTRRQQRVFDRVGELPHPPTLYHEYLRTDVMSSALYR